MSDETLTDSIERHYSRHPSVSCSYSQGRLVIPLDRLWETIMDIVGFLAIVLGVAGVVLGGLSWWKASEAKALAASALRLAQEAKKVLADASRVAGEPAAAARAGTWPARDIARESEEAVAIPPVAPTELAPQLSLSTHVDAAWEERTANVVVRSGSSPDHDLPTNQGTGSGLIGIFLVNEGPANAHAMQLRATFPNGTQRRSESQRSLSAHKELTLFAQVVPPDFGAHDPLHVLYQVAYRDGNGEQELERTIRVEGGWKGSWKTFIEANAGDV
jgi:hypothetical protein